MYVKEKYNNLITALSSIYDSNEASNIATLLLQKRLNTTSISLIAKEIITEALLHQLQKDEDQLLQHKPIQYVIEEAWFYKFPFWVNESVLIPRPETELLVQQCLQEASKKNTTINILDIGTGSGCIAICVKKEMPTAIVTAIDISKEALIVANKNAQLLQVDINLIEANILEADITKLGSEATIIVSNPPYIPIEQMKQMHANVLQYEPHQALFVPNNNPLLFYKKLAALCVVNKATLCCEISEYLGKETKVLLQQYFTTVTIHNDFENKQRIIVANF